MTLLYHQQDFGKSESESAELLRYPSAIGILYWELA